MLESLARYEWLLMGVIIIGLAGVELISVNRSIKRDKTEAPKPGASRPGASRPGAVSPANRSDGPPPPGG
jgi:hypothetical protein